jgi:hypothetical protein
MGDDDADADVMKLRRHLSLHLLLLTGICIRIIRRLLLLRWILHVWWRLLLLLLLRHILLRRVRSLLLWRRILLLLRVDRLPILWLDDGLRVLRLSLRVLWLLSLYMDRRTNDDTR